MTIQKQIKDIIDFEKGLLVLDRQVKARDASYKEAAQELSIVEQQYNSIERQANDLTTEAGDTAELEKKKAELNEKEAELNEKEAELNEKEAELNEMLKLLEQMKKQLEVMVVGIKFDTKLTKQDLAYLKAERESLIKEKKANQAKAKTQKNQKGATTTVAPEPIADYALQALDGVLLVHALAQKNSALEVKDQEISLKSDVVISIIKAVDDPVREDIERRLAKAFGVPADNSIVKAIVTQDLILAIANAAEQRDGITKKFTLVEKICDMILKQLNKVCPYIKDAFTKHLETAGGKKLVDGAKTHVANLEAKAEAEVQKSPYNKG